MIGTLLCGRYRLEDQIGSGGMSTVYRAFDDTLERWVAIKLLHGALLDDPLQLERFRREARTVARLSHPHVVNVIDAGEDGGHPFIVLEYVDGETLKARVRRLGRLPIVEAVAYAIEIGRALMAAHGERLVHRDVKPQNVMIDADGRAKVTDFGISRSLEEDGLTATGRVLGTTDYVAPEQALGEGIFEQSDVYSLGVCLFEMLTGEVPFKADSQVGVAMKHVRDPLPDVRRVRPEVSAALAAVVERATAKQRRNRYATAEAMVADLEQALAIEAARTGQANGAATMVLGALPRSTARIAPRRLRQPRRMLALGTLAAAAAAVAIVVLALNTHSSPHAPVARSALVKPPLATPLRTAAVYDPFGDGNNAAMAPKAILGGPDNFWSTEDYSPGGGLGSKPGVGIYVEAASAVAARRLDLTSATPGNSFVVYASNTVPDPSGVKTAGDMAQWGSPVGAGQLAAATRLALDTHGRAYRYYLIWIDKLVPPYVARLADVKLAA